MPSSTSSSDVPYRDVPDRDWGLAWFTCVVLVAIALAGWEVLARSMHHLPGNFGEDSNFIAQWAEERHKLDDPNDDTRVVLLGSSRILWATDLDILEEELGTRPLQLAIAGTGPALMLENIVEETDFDGLAIIGVTPFLFNRLDGGIFGAEALQWYEDPAPSQLSGHRIHAFLANYFGFIDDGFKLFQLIDHYSDFPERDGVYNLSAGGWKLGNHYEDRQTDMWGPVEVEGSFDNEQILAFWMRGLSRDPESPERMQEMVDTSVEHFVPLIEKLRARGGDAVFIRMPGNGKYLEHAIKTNYRELTWNPMTEGFDAVSINTMDYPELSSELEIPEWAHLSRKSQDDFSRLIVPKLKQIYVKERGHSIDDIIHRRAAGE